MGTFVTASPHVPLPADRTNNPLTPPAGLTYEVDASHINDTQNALNDLFTYVAGRFNVKSYGAAGDNVTVDSIAIAACIAAAKAYSSNLGLGAEVYFPPGTYLVSSKVLLSECTGVALRGSGRGITIIKPTSITTDEVVQLRNCTQCVVEEMTILGETAHPPYAQLGIRAESGFSGYLSTKNVARNVNLGLAAGSLYKAGKGISISGNIDANNDFHTFENVYSYGATYADVAIDNSQSADNSFINCHLNGASSGAQYGIIAAATRDRSANGESSLTPGGTFHTYGGSNGGHTAADFRPSLGPGTSTVMGGNSEGSYRLVETAFLPGVWVPFHIERFRYSSDSAQAADNVAILFQHCGGLTVRKCRFDQSDVTKFAKISVASSSPSSYDIRDNVWNQPGSESLDMIVRSYVGPSGSYPGAQFFIHESNTYVDSNSVQHWKGTDAEPIRGPDTVATVVKTARSGSESHVLDFPYTLANAAATTQSLAAFSIRAGYRLTSCVLKVVTPMTGGAISALTASVGKTGALTNILLAGDVKAAAAGTHYGLLDAEKGAAFTRAASESGGYLPSMSADTQVNVALTSTGANLNALTAGSLRLYFTVQHVGD